jgi:hypothetical protein
VLVDYATDAYSELTANPDGTFDQNVSASPQRVEKDGSWASLDATLNRNADGTYSTTATTARLTLSGGGDAPLAAMDDGGKKLAFSWPASLPAPEVTGSTALYTNVLPDVDLSVQANVQGGFSDTVIVKSTAGAQNPELKNLVLGTTAAGVSLSADAAGNLTATDDSGRAIYHSPAPLMWDSSQSSSPASSQNRMLVAQAESEPSSADGPQPGAQVAPVGVQVAGDTLKLTPSSDLLGSSDTIFPVYIDPDYTPIWVPDSRLSADYTYIQSGHPGISNWDDVSDYDSHGIGVGYQGFENPNGVERSFYQFNVGTLIDSKTIDKATLLVDETYTASYGCETHDVKAYSMASHIDPTSTWDNFAGRTATYLNTQPIGGAYNTGCAGAFHSSFDVKSAIASDGDGIITLELVGNESDRDQFKRFAKSATLSYTYNTIPSAVASSMAAQPAPQTGYHAPTQGCNDPDGPWGWISKNGDAGYVTLSGKVSDADSGDGQLVYGQFALWDDSTPGGATAIISLGVSPGGTLDSNSDDRWQGSGSTAHKRVAVSNLVNGHSYGWLMRANDGINASASTPACHFRYDATAPAGLTVAGTSVSGSCVDGGTLTPDTDGHIVIPITATDTGSGVDHFRWTLAAASDLAGDQGNALVPPFPLTLTPAWGSYFLNVAAIDKAGNESGAACLSFYVPDNPAPLTAGDIDGDGLPDLAAVPAPGSYPTNPGLRFYDTKTPNPTGSIASNSTDGPNTDGTWIGALTAHRSSLERSSSGADTADDLWALGTDSPKPLLWFYRNNISGGIQNHAGQYYSYDSSSTYSRPTCDSAKTDCTGYGSDWSAVTQLIAPGDMTGDDAPDLVTKEGNYLWLFPGTSQTGKFGSPQKIGTGGWGGFTAISPGETPATKGLAPLWGRDNTSGDLFQFASSRDSTGKITLTRSQIGSHYPLSDYPLIASVGDISGDGIPDLIATTTSGSLVDQLGTATPSTTEFDGTLGLPGRIAASGWNQIQSIS